MRRSELRPNEGRSRRRRERRGGRRFQLLLAGVFAVSALFQVVIGTYGVVMYSVEQRPREAACAIPAVGATRLEPAAVWRTE